MIAATAERQAATVASDAAHTSAILANMSVYKQRREEHARREENARRARDRRYDTIDTPEPLELLHDTVTEYEPTDTPDVLPEPVDAPEPVNVSHHHEHTADAVDSTRDTPKVQGHNGAWTRLQDTLAEYARRKGKHKHHAPHAYAVYGGILRLCDWTTGTFRASLSTSTSKRTIPNITGLTRKTATAGMHLLIEIEAVTRIEQGGMKGKGEAEASAYILAEQYRPNTSTNDGLVPTGYPAPCTHRVPKSIYLNNSKYVRHSLPAALVDTPPSEKQITLKEYAEHHDVPDIVYRFAERRKHFHPDMKQLRYLPRTWAYLCNRITEPPSEPHYIAERGDVDESVWEEILPFAIDQFFNEKRFRTSDYGLALFCEDIIKEMRLHIVKGYALNAEYDDEEEDVPEYRTEGERAYACLKSLIGGDVSEAACVDYMKQCKYKPENAANPKVYAACFDYLTACGWSPPTEYPEDFQRFWKQYPDRAKTATKSDALRYWKKWEAERPPVDELIAIARDQFERGKLSTQHPATWLNNRRWLDAVGT